MRRYDDGVEVRWVHVEPDADVDDREAMFATAWGDAAVEPQAFVWRGRLYVVRRVLDRWVERTAWWRCAGEPTHPDRTNRVAPASTRPVSPHAPARLAGLAVADLEDPVWRVEAAAGRDAPVGVYDLSGRPGQPWRLLRVGD